MVWALALHAASSDLFLTVEPGITPVHHHIWSQNKSQLGKTYEYMT